MQQQPLARELTMTRDGRTDATTLVIHGPTFNAEWNCWDCQIEFPPARSKPIVIHGDDGFQALLLSLRFIRSEIADLKECGIDLYWLTPGDDGAL